MKRQFSRWLARQVAQRRARMLSWAYIAQELKITEDEAREMYAVITGRRNVH